MNIKRIIYYTQENNCRRSLSLRCLHIKDANRYKLEDIFYAVRDAANVQSLIEKLEKICSESFSLETETISYITFKVTDIYEHTNYFKLKKIKTFLPKGNRDENNKKTGITS